MTNNLHRLPLRTVPGRAILIDKHDMYYIEAKGDDSLIRTARRKRYPRVEPLESVEGRLPSPPFFRIHRSYIVNLNRVYELQSRGDAGLDHRYRQREINTGLSDSRKT